MALLIDFLPLLLFFAANYHYGIFVATAVAIPAFAIQMAYLYWQKKLTTMHWVVFASVAILGGATLLLRDEAFIKWRPTVLNAIFAFVLVAAKLLWKRDLLRIAIQHAMKAATKESFELPDRVWAGLTWAWVSFFAFLSILNYLVAFRLGFSTDAWVAYKVFVVMGLFALFMLGQGLVIAFFCLPKEPQDPQERQEPQEP